MNKLVILILFTAIVARSEQIAFTDNGAKVVLFDDSTWLLVEVSERTFDDNEDVRILPFAVTEDSQLVLLSEKMWGFITPEDTVGISYDKIDLPILPYYMLEKPPQLRLRIRPQYPWGARVKGHEGTTVVKALIDTNGEVMRVDILQSSGYMELDQAAMKAAWKWRFNPAEHKGYRVRVWVSMPFNFRLIEE